MKKYIFFLGVLFWACSFATPDELDDTFQTFNPEGVTNANIAANNTVQIAVPTPDGKILIGGDFTTYKGTTVNRLARINRDGTLDASFTIQTDTANTLIGLDAGTVNAIAIAPGGTANNYSIIIGGTFTKVRNKTQNRLAKIDCVTTSGAQTCSLDLDFVLADTLDGATGGSVNVIGFVPGGTANNYGIILGGSFTKIKKITQNRLSRIDCVITSGTQACSVNTNLVPAVTNAGAANAVNAIAFAPGSTLSDFDLFLGGAFMSYAGFSQRGVAKISCTTQSGNQTCALVTNFFGTGATNGINTGVVNAFVIFPGGTPDSYSFLIGGTFTKFNNIVQNRLTRVLSDGTVDANFVGTDATDGANGAIETIAIYDNGVTLLGGAFASYASVPRNRLVQLSESGELDPYFSNVLPVGPDNVVQKIVIEQDGKIIVTGQFTKYSDLTTGRIVRLRGMTSALSSAGCPAGTTFCGFDNSCVADMSQCASCPADFIHRSESLSPADFTPSVLPAQSVWGNLPDMTIARIAHDVVAVNNKIYVFGGQEANTVNTEIFDPITNTWSQPAAARYPVGTSAAGIMVAAIGEKIYTFHGKNTYEYNTSTQTWTQKASNTISRTHGSAVAVDGKIYVIGGMNSYKNQIYDPLRNTWSNAADIPKTGFASYGFSYTQAAALGGKIYLIGGVSMDTFQYYDPCLNRWIALPDLTDFPTSNQYSSHSTVVVNGEIYVSGGSLARGNGTPVEVIHKKYNPTTRQWTALANLPSPLMHNKGAVIDGKIYVIGGASNTTANTPSKKAYVYNASDNILTDESISACNCTPSCGEGKYYSLVDNLCKPAQQLTVVPQCNKNGICEIGESCDCFDCTNGGLDDRDSCGISQGAQMYCSRDTSFQMPGAPAQSMTYNDSRLFLQETNSTTFSYEHILGPQQATLRILGPEYSFGPNAPTIRGYDVSKTYGNDRIHFSRRQLSVPGSINKLPANSYYLKNVSLGFNTEKFDFMFDKDIQAFGIEMYEPTGDISATGCNAVCVQSTFKFLLYDDGVLVDDTITFSPPDNQDTFFGFWSPEKFDKIEVREIVGTADNEFFGRIYYQDRSAGEQQCRIEKKIAHLFTNSNGTYTWFAPYTPREVINPFDPSQKVYVYKRERNIKWTADRVRANPQLAWDSAEDVTSRPVGSSNAPYDLIDANITNTTRANYLFGTSSRVHMALFGRLRTDGSLQTYFNDTSGGTPAFTRGSPYVAGATTNPQMMVQFADGGNSPNCADGYVCFDNRAVVGVYDIQVCEKTDAEICAVGACCPVGKKWDCDTNACILDTLTCPAGQIKKPAPGSALCLLRARVITPSQVDYLIQGFDGMDGSCSVTYNPLLGPSSGVLSVEENERQFQPGLTSVVLTPSALNDSFSCPAGMVEGVCQTTNSEEGGVVGDILCGCYPNPSVTMKVNITEFQNVTQTVTLGDGNKVQNNVAFDLYNNGQPIVDASLPTGNTKDMGIRRGPGTVEFFGYDKVNNTLPATIKGRITIQGAKISTINAVTRSTQSLDLEEGNNDYVRRIDDYALEFSHYFSEPGDKWSLSYELPEPILSQPEYACVIEGCGEGQYWCSSEAICKNGNEPCGIVTCNNDAVCDLEESCDCADCNNQIDHCGLNTNDQQLFCSKDSATESSGCPQGYTPDTNGVCVPSSTPAPESFQRFDTQSSFASAHTGMTMIGYDTITLTGGRLPTFLYTFPGTGVSIRPNDAGYTTNNLFVSDLSNVLSGKEIYVTGKEHFEINFSPAVNAFGFDFNESTSCRAGFCPLASVQSIFTIRFYDGSKKLQEYTFEPQDNVASFFGAASKRPFDRVSIQEVTGTVDDEALGKMYFQRFTDSLCQAYTPTQVLYTPNVTPLKQGWSSWDGVGTPQVDGGKFAWQVNDANTSNGATLTKKPSAQEITQFYAQGGKLSAEIKNISSGTMTAPTNAAHLMASYLELSVGQTTNTDGSIRPRKRFTLTFGMDANRTPTVYAFTDADYDGTTPYKYTVTGGADKYNLYEMVYDPVSHTVDVFVNGTEQISNYPGNIVTSGNLQSANQITTYFGSGSSPGTAKTNYGAVQLTLRNTACSAVTPTPVVAQPGACCPAGTQWNSAENKCMPNCPTGTSWDVAQNKCTTPTCAEGQYYCHSELKCKSANQTCGTVTCNNNGTCNEFESCDCADCNGQVDHCGIVNGEQLFCTKDPAPQCYTDRFPYCFPLCLDGYALDPATNQCVVSGGVSISAPIFKNCSEILANNPSTPSGDYTIDPDGLGGKPPLLASCDMTTDGGGWTLIANAAVPAAKNGTINWTDKPYFPLLGNYTVGQDNTTSTTTFGFVDKTIGQSLVNNAKEVRVFAENTTGNKVDIKTDDLPAVTKYLIRDAGTDPTTNITKLPNDTGVATGIMSVFDSASYGDNIVWIWTVPNLLACRGSGSGVTGQTLLSGKISAACTHQGGYWGVGTVGAPDCGCPTTGVSDSVRANIWVKHDASAIVPSVPKIVGACCPAGAQWSSANNKCETNCTTTQAPSELKAGVDQPYISCTAGPSGTTHFKYRLTDASAPTATPFISEIYVNGTPVLHPVINTAGSYKVECFYGNAASVDTSNTATPSTCVKNITVKNDPNTQGCEGIVSYKGTTLTTTLEDTNVFTARFQCINRISENPLLSNPFRIQYATNNFINLGFATVIDPNLASSIGLNRLSAQDQYSFQPGTTSVTCAVKVGDGYSTNNSCQKNACVGSSCSTPQTFSVVHSSNLTCTTQAAAEYKIGCNPDAPESNRTACVNWLTQMAGTNTSFKAPFIFNGTLYGSVDCNKYGPNDPALGGVNMQANIVCRATLNNGQQYTILAADAGGSPINSLQTTTYTVKKDSTNPDLLPLELYLNPTLTLQVTDFDRWYNVPLTLVARCSDQPGISDGDECACAPETLSDPTLWTRGVPHAQFGPDIMYYTRTISASTNNISAQVKDTAGNPSNISPQISLNIDTQPPVVAITETGSGASRTIQLSVTDTNSKIWTNLSIPTGGQNNGGVIYRSGPKADTQNLMLDTDCGVSPVSLLPTVAQTVSIPSNKVITIPNINTSNTVVTYCVKDNAGNVTRGSYPTVSNACFSASNMSTVPNFDTYKDALITRLNTNKYGYSFSENSADAQCFRGILANNVATLIANQLTPRTETDLDWGTSLAFVRNTNNRNTNGYYYYSYSTNNTLRISTSPSDSGTKTVVVDGGNIQITQDINYSGTGKLLVLIARKNNNGQGGNVLIDPTVSNIDAIIIADGGALINTDINTLGERLTINGRIYSYNTRGGSLTVSGADLVDASSGKQFNNSTLVNSSQFSESRAQDLERFRTMSVDGNTQCSLHVNYQVLTNNQLPLILQRPATFGGSCGF